MAIQVPQVRVVQGATKNTQVLVIAYRMVIWDVAPKQFAGHSRVRPMWAQRRLSGGAA